MSAVGPSASREALVRRGQDELAAPRPLAQLPREIVMENKKDSNKKDSGDEKDRDGEPESKGVGIILLAVMGGVFVLLMVINMC